MFQSWNTALHLVLRVTQCYFFATILPMKKILRLLIMVPLLLIYLNTWAAESPNLRIQIDGIEGPALENVQERLNVLQASFGKTLTDEEVHQFYQEAPSNIRKALEPFAYFKATTKPTLTHDKNGWLAHFTIDPGAPLLITQVNVSVTGPGKDNETIQKFIQHFPIAAQQVFSAEDYDKAKNTFFETVNNQGYIKATLAKKKVYINLKTYTAIITLCIDTGERYYFGSISFDQTVFSESFLKRFLTFHDGDPYSPGKLLTFQQNLNNSHFFQEVTVNPDVQKPKNFQVPVNVYLKANKSQQYNFGLGYGSFTGPRVTLGMNLRHLTKTGHHLNVQAKMSSVLTGLAAQYVIPGFNPLTDEYTIGANVQRFLPKNGHSISKTLSVGYVKTIHHWKNSINLNYLRENSEITDPSMISHNSRILYLSYNLSHTKANDIVNPTSGHKIDFIIKGANVNIVSNTSFIQSEIKGKYIFSSNNNSKIILRGDLGYTVVKDLTTLPITLQFFSGGLDTVRIFPYSYEGPGRYLKVLSAEYQHHIIGKWNGAVFFDTGTASDHFYGPLDRSAGIGIIYQSVVGPLKLYLGHELTGRNPSFGIDFSIGPEL